MDYDPNSLPPGTMITGYRIVRTLGAGDFGITYEAHGEVTGRRVAIKEFFPRGIASRANAVRAPRCVGNQAPKHFFAICEPPHGGPSDNKVNASAGRTSSRRQT